MMHQMQQLDQLNIQKQKLKEMKTDGVYNVEKNI